MFHTVFSKLAIGVVSITTAIYGLFGIASKQDVQNVQDQLNTLQVQQLPIGAQIPIVVSLFETSLASKISSSDSSMTLVTGTDRNGTALNGYMCFTIDEGTASVEFVCGTASSTAISSLSRGIDPITGSTSVAGLKKEHRRGATVKITNYPQLAIVSRILSGQETLPNPLQYETSVSTTTLAGNALYLASVDYVNTVALQSAPTATTTLAGVVQVATSAQVGAGVGLNGVYTLVPAASLFNQTPRAAITVPVTNASGKIAQGFLNLNEPFTFTATTSLAATSTAPLIVRGINYTFPASQGAANTFLVNDGSGNLSWTVDTTVKSYASSTISSSGITSSQTLDFNYNTGFTPKVITVYYNLTGDNNNNTPVTEKGIATFDGTSFRFKYLSDGSLSAGNPTAGQNGTTNDCLITMSVSTASSTGFTIRLTTATNGSPTGCGYTFAPTATR